MNSHLQMRRGASRNGEQGYILLMLMLMVSLIIIAVAAVGPTIAFQVRRDREEEMIHRGVQYSRAIRNYYKKFGRYPARLEDLDNTNNLRFLRKHYKDPVTGGDFKILRYGDVKMSLGGPLAGAANVNPAAAVAGNSVFGNSAAGNSAFGNSGFGNSSSVFGQSQTSGSLNSQSATADAAKAAGTDAAGANADQTQPGGANSSSSSSSGTPQPGPFGSSSSNSLSGQTFGGLPIVGVASTSKKESIREFNHKRKYNEWQFIYDPSTDRGGLLMTPNQPPLQGFGGNNQLQPGQQGNTSNSPFGSSPSGFGNNQPGFGNPSGFGNNNPGFNNNPNPPQNPQPNNPQNPQ